MAGGHIPKQILQYNNNRPEMNMLFGNGKDDIPAVEPGSSSSHRPNKKRAGKKAFPTKRLPVLIFPGFMSSALRAEDSGAPACISSTAAATAPVGSGSITNSQQQQQQQQQNKSSSSSSSSSSWDGKRIWLSVKSAGFAKLDLTGSLHTNEQKKELGQDYDEELHQEYKKEAECKNRWLRHVKLSDDLRSDPDGVRVRPMQGLYAVNYLDPGGLVKHVSWVFQPVTKALIEEGGYRDGHDLDAAPYDWRIPPSDLETRDGYFSNTMERVEKMYEDNNNTPVVLLCHSMGCKTCHYFLNFTKAKAGQEWIDKYVHTYMPVGAPHLGAPKTLRGVMVGDKMGLDAFLSEEEALIVSRTFGSVPWMFPYILPPDMPSCAYLRRNGVLHVTVLPFDCADMLGERKNKPTKLRLDVTYNNTTLRSKFHSPSSSSSTFGKEGDQFTMRFPETFTFATSPDMPTAKDDDDDGNDATLRISLYEPGLHLAEQHGMGCCGRVLKALNNVVDLLFPSLSLFWRRFNCAKQHEVVGAAVAGAAVTTATAVTSLFGSATLLAGSEEKRFDLSLVDDETQISADNHNQAPKEDADALQQRRSTKAPPRAATEFSVQLRFGDMRKLKKDLMERKVDKKDIVLGETSSMPVKVRVEWRPSTLDFDTHQLTDVRIAVPSQNAPDLNVHHAKDKGVVYESVSGLQLLVSEGLPRYRDVLTHSYQTDPLCPRTCSAEDAPPVKKVKAVYGIDLPTEVGAAYQRRSIVQEEGRMKCLHEVDTSVQIDSKNFLIKDGVILETEKTPQTGETDEEVIHRSGDGTVPYYSLQQSRKWKDKCDVEIDELPRAEHREILGDERFLQLLLDYVTE